MVEAQNEPAGTGDGGGAADLESLRYPIGRYEAPSEYSPSRIETWIDQMERLPAELRAAVEPLTVEQLEVPYRPGGWCTRQVVHHVADSHSNSLTRFKWALTEDRPTIKPYFEERWARLPDVRDTPIEVSLSMLEAIHQRMVILLRALGPAELEREFVHPEFGVVRVAWNIGFYAWHGRHHVAHVTRLAEREGWRT